MNREIIEQLLENAMHPNERLRMEAETMLKDSLSIDFMKFVSILATIMLDTKKDMRTRSLAAIISRNGFHYKSAWMQKEMDQKWLETSETLREEYRNVLISNLNIQDQYILQNITEILGTIMKIEICNAVGYSTLIRMQQTLLMAEYASGTLDAVGSACDQMVGETEHNFDYEEQKTIYSIATYYSLENTADEKILASALECICSSVEIYDQLLQNDEQIEMFYSSLLKYKYTGNSNLLEIAITTLTRFMDTYKHNPGVSRKLSYIAGQYIEMMGTGDESVRLALIDFWKMMYEMESIDILKENLIPLAVSLESYMKKDDTNVGSWSSNKASSELLVIFTDDLHFPILSIEQIQKNIFQSLMSGDDDQMARGALALGSVMRRGNSAFVGSVLPCLLKEMENSNCADEVLYAIARIIEKDIDAICDCLEAVIKKVAAMINEMSEHVENAAWLLNAFLVAANASENPKIQDLLKWGYSNLMVILVGKITEFYLDLPIRNVITSALSELVAACPENERPLLDHLERHIYEKTLSVVSSVPEMAKEQLELIDPILSSYITILDRIIEKKRAVDNGELYKLVSQCLSTNENNSFGDIYILLSNHMKFVIPTAKSLLGFLKRDIGSGNTFVSKAAIRLVGDLFMFTRGELRDAISPLLQEMIKTLSDGEVELDTKKLIISTFGELALSLGAEFEPYPSFCVYVHEQVNKMIRKGDEEYVDSLRRSVMYMISCVVLAVGRTEKMKERMPQIMENIQKSVMEDEDLFHHKESITLLSDIKKVFGKEFVNKEWIRLFLEPSQGMYDGEERQMISELLMVID